MTDLRRRVLLFGSAPPPHGGIQQHCVRLRSYLKESGFEAKLMDFNRRARIGGVEPIRNWSPGVIAAIARFRPDIVHNHSYRWRATVTIAGLRGLGAFGTVLTVHGESFHYGVPTLARPLFRRALRRFDALVADNPDLRDWLVEEAGVEPGRVSVLHPFLPPAPEQRDASALPEEVRAFASRSDPLLLVNGALSSFRGLDKYGIDQAVEVARRLRERMPRLGLLFVSTGTQHREREEKVLTQVTEAGLGDAFLKVEELEEILPALSAADALLRTTVTDGDSLIVREALMEGIPVVASDASERPEGCEVYRCGEADDLERAVERALARGRDATRGGAGAVHAGPDIVEIYERLLSPRVG